MAAWDQQCLVGKTGETKQLGFEEYNVEQKQIWCKIFNTVASAVRQFDHVEFEHKVAYDK